jgi:proline dehydrogenase
MLRRTLLWASTNAWLRRQSMRRRFIRKSVSRFMPGETLDDAVEAATRLREYGISTILTHLGENLGRLEEADAVYEHYLGVVERVTATGLDAHLSVKPTQLGYDQNVDACFGYLVRLLDRATAAGTFLWLDMESSRYVDGTLSLYRRLRERSPNVGVALQAYLHRTAADVEALIPLGAAIRLVKGAYLEPASVAYPKKSDVDRNYFSLGSQLLAASTRPGALVHIATHDVTLQDRLERLIDEQRIPPERYEFAMLYGIGAGRQRELAARGARIRSLISYGEFWFPWYLRRLAERPANVWFVAKNAFQFTGN